MTPDSRIAQQKQKRRQHNESVEGKQLVYMGIGVDAEAERHKREADCASQTDATVEESLSTGGI